MPAFATDQVYAEKKRKLSDVGVNSGKPQKRIQSWKSPSQLPTLPHPSTVRQVYSLPESSNIFQPSTLQWLRGLNHKNHPYSKIMSQSSTANPQTILNPTRRIFNNATWGNVNNLRLQPSNCRKRSGTLNLNDNCDVLTVWVHGACSWVGTPAAKASYGVWFDHGSWYNECYLIPSDHFPQTKEAGELVAAIRALHTIWYMPSARASKLKQVVVVTNSMVLVDWIANTSLTGTYTRTNPWDREIAVIHKEYLSLLNDWVEKLARHCDVLVTFHWQHRGEELWSGAASLATSVLAEGRAKTDIRFNTIGLPLSFLQESYHQPL